MIINLGKKYYAGWLYGKKITRWQAFCIKVFARTRGFYFRREGNLYTASFVRTVKTKGRT